ncbi:hypothetical protein EV424DRAFT_1536147 [Suillus variegatus]|nr:hypothetical protein EV424DRAFT_1536147 [Suillus variegatus]
MSEDHLLLWELGNFDLLPPLSMVDPKRIQSPVFDSTHNTRRKARLPRHAVVSNSHPLLVPEEMYTLILLQGYDGSFTPSPQLKALLGAEILENAADL